MCLERNIKRRFFGEGRLHKSETQMFIKKGRALEKELVMVKKKKRKLTVDLGSVIFEVTFVIIWRPHEPCSHKAINLIDKYFVCFVCFTSHSPVSLTPLSLFHEIQQY